MVEIFLSRLISTGKETEGLLISTFLNLEAIRFRKYWHDFFVKKVHLFFSMGFKNLS